MKTFTSFLCIAVYSLAAEEDGTGMLMMTDSLDTINNYPSLHTLAELFLYNGARQFFEVIVLLIL